MNCPVCKEPMIILEYEQVEVDYCTSCHGIWLDSGELELLFGDREMTKGFLNAGDPHRAAGERPRKCPVCRRRMDKQTTGGEPPVTFDHCPKDHGMWFDRGELSAILRHGSPAPGGEAVGQWLREMFPDRETAPG